MLRKSLLAALGFVVMAAMSSSKAQAAVVVGVVVGPVVVAHPSLVVDPRPHVYYGPPRSYAHAPVRAYPGPGYYVRQPLVPPPYAYRRCVGLATGDASSSLKFYAAPPPPGGGAFLYLPTKLITPKRPFW